MIVYVTYIMYDRSIIGPWELFGPVRSSMITGFEILESNSDKVTFWEPGETASIDPIIWIDCFKTWYSRGVVDDRPRKLFLTKLSIAWNTVKSSQETYSMLYTVCNILWVHTILNQRISARQSKIILWLIVYLWFKNKWMIVITVIGIGIILSANNRIKLNEKLTWTYSRIITDKIRFL